VYTLISEKDINLQKEYGRFWEELSLHRYDFNKQANELEALEQLTKEDFIKHFDDTFFNKETSKRVDLELTSVKHTEEQAKFTESNNSHHLFSEVTKRVRMSLENFKKSVAYHPDIVKSDFAAFRNK